MIYQVIILMYEQARRSFWSNLISISIFAILSITAFLWSEYRVSKITFLSTVERDSMQRYIITLESEIERSKAVFDSVSGIIRDYDIKREKIDYEFLIKREDVSKKSVDTLYSDLLRYLDLRGGSGL